MSQRKTQNTKRKTHCAQTPPPLKIPPPFNFNIFLKYFKYLYFNFYINFPLLLLFFFKKKNLKKFNKSRIKSREL